MKKNLKLMYTAIAVLVLILALTLMNKTPQKAPIRDEVDQSQKINTMMMLIEFEEIDGVLQWEKELDSRGLTAMIKVQDNVLEANPEAFKRMSDKGYEIAGGYDVAPFWDMPYKEQYDHLKAAKELVESITNKKMKVFGSRYFAYDENTLKAAAELDIEYILARGTHDVSAVIYSPSEYPSKIISVSNVDVGEMGKGSLCDYSLWARGSSPEDFGIIINESIAKNPENMIIVSHSYLGGTRLAWWKEYEKALESDRLNWQGFPDWVNSQEFIYANNADIPVNTEVKYVAPNPEKGIEAYEVVPGLEYLTKDMGSGNTEITPDEMLCQ
ncbi:MAG: hypothetical protein EOM88_03590 [Clostridia bacterium]|nr:hypothetical protein [Clostridia bacterium]